jgi:hypothetical protein
LQRLVIEHAGRPHSMAAHERVYIPGNEN